jgi:quinol-cytochrome oxidoreductase complex cytochrome b subunit
MSIAGVLLVLALVLAVLGYLLPAVVLVVVALLVGGRAL